jgi:hypothetical protein
MFGERDRLLRRCMLVLKGMQMCECNVVHACQNALEDTICEPVMINPEHTHAIIVQPDETDMCITLRTFVGSLLVRQLVYNSSCTEYNYEMFSRKKSILCSTSP